MLNLVVSKNIRLKILLFVTALMVWSCGSSIAVFNQRAYENATTLKAEASALMNKASEPYANHADEVLIFMTRVDVAYEYVNGISKNEISTNQWRILKDPEGNLLGGFFKLWGKNGKLLLGDIEAIKKNVLNGFDTIIDLEAVKIKN